MSIYVTLSFVLVLGAIYRVGYLIVEAIEKAKNEILEKINTNVL